ncbi:MAG: hypothetical protein ACREML_05180 [Vulcanimicrobiaceae bacterium]
MTYRMQPTSRSQIPRHSPAARAPHDNVNIITKAGNTGEGDDRRRFRRFPTDVDRWFRACAYLGAAQLYLRDNALLREPLRPEHIKPRLLGFWGTQPGLALVAAHVNRLIRTRTAKILLVVGPGHAAPAILAVRFWTVRSAKAIRATPVTVTAWRIWCAISRGRGLASHLTHRDVDGELARQVAQDGA